MTVAEQLAAPATENKLPNSEVKGPSGNGESAVTKSKATGGGNAGVQTDAAESAVLSGNLELLSGVELPVTLCFGRRRMRLREVLELNAGSVVELDRLVEEPVELLLEGRVIARGELVVVDGSYGLRVLEVVSGAIA